MNRDIELYRLLQADRHVAEAEAALVKQIADLDKQHYAGHDTALAERGVRAFAASLDALKYHRELIARTILQIDGGAV